VGPTKHALDVGAQWRNLANTAEPSMYGGDADFLSNFISSATDRKRRRKTKLN